jgi:hypothetical protein
MRLGARITAAFQNWLSIIKDLPAVLAVVGCSSMDYST